MFDLIKNAPFKKRAIIGAVGLGCYLDIKSEKDPEVRRKLMVLVVLTCFSTVYAAILLRNKKLCDAFLREEGLYEAFYYTLEDEL